MGYVNVTDGIIYSMLNSVNMCNGYVYVCEYKAIYKLYISYKEYKAIKLVGL